MATIGPIVLVVIAGAALTAWLGSFAERHQLTERLAQLLKDTELQIMSDIRQIKYETRRVLNYADKDPIGFMHKLFGVPYFGR